MVEKFADQIVFWGKEGASHFLQETLGKLSAKRVLLVTGKNSYQLSGAEAFILPIIGNIESHRVSEFQPNPTLTDTLQGVKQFQAFKPDCIIAIGGGSVLDMAKLINFFGSTGLDATNYLEEKVDVELPALLPLIAIPTTAGTGSEATHFSVLYYDKIKYSVAEKCMLPNGVVLNPELTQVMTPYQTACTGMDALAQGIESYWAVGSTAESREYAEKAIRLAWQFLEPAVKQPTLESREKMQEAAYWAGRAINISKTTLCHALSYVLTSHYGYPHGHAVAVFLPEIFRAHARSKVVSDFLSGLLGEGRVADNLHRLVLEIGLGRKNVFHEEDICTAVSGVNLERLKNNPLEFSEQGLEEVVRLSLMN